MTTRTKDIQYSYESVAELVEACRVPLVNRDNKSIAELHSSEGFICGDRRDIRYYRDAVAEIAKPLFEAGVKRIERCAKLLDVPTPRSIKRKVRRGAEGDELDMARVWGGDLENAWSKASRTSTVGASRIYIRVSPHATWDIDAQIIAWRGVAALALADALEGAGYVVEIVMQARATRYLRNGSEGPMHNIEVLVKDTGTQLDIHKCASLLASTLLYRGVTFLHIATHSKEALGGGTCYPKGPSLDAQPGFDFTAVASAEIKDADTAQEWVTTQLALIEATHNNSN